MTESRITVCAKQDLGLIQKRKFYHLIPAIAIKSKDPSNFGIVVKTYERYNPKVNVCNFVGSTINKLGDVFDFVYEEEREWVVKK